MYRVNKEGAFNVPFNGGERDASILYKTAILYESSELLKNIELLESDFEDVIERAGSDDVIYCDPTYTVAHNNNGFLKYNESIFSWDDQERLCRVAIEAVQRGATVIMSNAFHRTIHKLYAGWKRITMKRFSSICPKSSCRKEIKESLFILSSINSKKELLRGAV